MSLGSETLRVDSKELVKRLDSKALAKRVQETRMRAMEAVFIQRVRLGNYDYQEAGLRMRFPRNKQ